ncbi:hypothetical protein CPXG_00016 [Cyanophage P-RSM6]|uniref:high light inducible protein n=1 Tax=Cyanophage P-RSM6 TaxID=929832 RepID=UPI000133A66B|nr:high light inducible protein [Cyanophage P-RSM6]AGH56819.1 hypothetical protein CPXG_00016 [Cyanophage P-RSM6]
MGSNDWIRCSNRCLRHHWSNHSRYILMDDKTQKTIAEKLNGRLAMLGIIAGLGAYLTTGQIIPGYV